MTIDENGKKCNVEDGGNGRLDAVSNALASHFGKPCDIFCYEEHSLKKGSDSSAIDMLVLQERMERITLVLVLTMISSELLLMR